MTPPVQPSQRANHPSRMLIPDRGVCFAVCNLSIVIRQKYLQDQTINGGRRFIHIHRDILSLSPLCSLFFPPRFCHMFSPSRWKSNKDGNYRKMIREVFACSSQTQSNSPRIVNNRTYWKLTSWKVPHLISTSSYNVELLVPLLFFPFIYLHCHDLEIQLQRLLDRY